MATEAGPLIDHLEANFGMIERGWNPEVRKQPRFFGGAGSNVLHSIVCDTIEA